MESIGIIIVICIAFTGIAVGWLLPRMCRQVLNKNEVFIVFRGKDYEHLITQAAVLPKIC